MISLYFNMKHIITILILCFISCSKEDSIKVEHVGSHSELAPRYYSLRQSQTYQLAPPIPEGDQWLVSYQDKNGYSDGWETWVWRLTSIEVGEGVRVYARGYEESQFLISGCFDGELMCVNFEENWIGRGGFYYGGTHQVALSPSGNYLVCITSTPRAFLHNGVALDCPCKTKGSWRWSIDEGVAQWWKIKKDSQQE